MSHLQMGSSSSSDSNLPTLWPLDLLHSHSSAASDAPVLLSHDSKTLSLEPSSLLFGQRPSPPPEAAAVTAAKNQSPKAASPRTSPGQPHALLSDQNVHALRRGSSPVSDARCTSLLSHKESLSDQKFSAHISPVPTHSKNLIPSPSKCNLESVSEGSEILETHTLVPLPADVSGTFLANVLRSNSREFGSRHSAGSGAASKGDNRTEITLESSPPAHPCPRRITFSNFALARGALRSPDHEAAPGTQSATRERLGLDDDAADQSLVTTGRAAARDGDSSRNPFADAMQRSGNGKSSACQSADEQGYASLRRPSLLNSTSTPKKPASSASNRLLDIVRSTQMSGQNHTVQPTNFGKVVSQLQEPSTLVDKRPLARHYAAQPDPSRAEVPVEAQSRCAALGCALETNRCFQTYQCAKSGHARPAEDRRPHAFAVSALLDERHPKLIKNQLNKDFQLGTKRELVASMRGKIARSEVIKERALVREVGEVLERLRVLETWAKLEKCERYTPVAQICLHGFRMPSPTEVTSNCQFAHDLGCEGLVLPLRKVVLLRVHCLWTTLHRILAHAPLLACPSGGGQNDLPRVFHFQPPHLSPRLSYCGEKRRPLWGARLAATESFLRKFYARLLLLKQADKKGRTVVSRAPLRELVAELVSSGCPSESWGDFVEYCLSQSA